MLRLNKTQGLTALSLLASLIISIASYHQSAQSNKISIEANKISIESKNLNREAIEFSKDVRSQQIVEKTYSDIYDNDLNRANVQLLKNGLKIGKADQVLKIVDSIEETGLSFCQGTARVRHIKVYLKNTLAGICTNDEVYSLYSGKKNGLAILCSEFFPNSEFAKTLNQENIGSCSFFDSGTFKNTAQLP